MSKACPRAREILGVFAMIAMGLADCTSGSSGSGGTGGAGWGGTSSSSSAGGGSTTIGAGGSATGGTGGGGTTTQGAGGAGSGGNANGGAGSGTGDASISGPDGGSDATGGSGMGGRATGGNPAGSGGPATGGAGGKGTGGTTIDGGLTATGGAGGASMTTFGTGGIGTSGSGTGGSTTGGSGASPAILFNGIQWADTTDNPIQAHGGGILKVGSYYYWFGENRNPDGTFYAVSCYRSTDLVHWEFRHNVLTQNSATELKPANIERPKIVYNATTSQYVMWMHWENGSDYGQARAAVAKSSTVDGDYTYLGSARPLVSSGVTDHGKPGYMSRDCTLFVDTDGKAYFISASNENNDLNLYRLSSDYLGIDSLVAVLFPGGHREAPALWKRGSVYFLLTSDATGWDPNQAKYATSASLGSGWSGWTNAGDSTTFHSQSAYVLAVEGSAGTAYLYIGDRWAGAWSGPVNDSTYVWGPISFSSSTAMSMSWSNTLTIDAAAGTVTGATNQFKLVNKSSGKALAIQGASTADHGTAIQIAYSGGDEQKWTLNYDGAGYFDVTNANSSKVLDVVSSSTADGAAIDQWTENSGDNQKWSVVDKGGGSYQLLNKNSSKLVEIPAGATADGAALDQRASSGGDNQLWQMTVAN
jgi:hypothetical protein